MTMTHFHDERHLCNSTIYIYIFYYSLLERIGLGVNLYFSFSFAAFEYHSYDYIFLQTILNHLQIYHGRVWKLMPTLDTFTILKMCQIVQFRTEYERRIQQQRNARNQEIIFFFLLFWQFPLSAPLVCGPQMVWECVCVYGITWSMHYVCISTYLLIPCYASSIHKHMHSHIRKPFEDSEPTRLKVDIASFLS